MYDGKKVSVVFGTYREKESIRKAIQDLYATGFIDEVVVVNNNAEKGTDEEVKKTRAKLVYEKRQGFGYAYQKAMEEASGDYIITSEADGTFEAKDLERLLVYAKDFDVVLGSRTSLIGSLVGARGMGVVRKFANVIEAKTIEILFNTNALTDVGCTLKLFTRKAYTKLKKFWRIEKTALFNTEVTLLVVREKIPFVEIPVTYGKRVGKSQIVGKWYQIVRWAIVIQLYIFSFWFGWMVRKLLKKSKPLF